MGCRFNLDLRGSVGALVGLSFCTRFVSLIFLALLRMKLQSDIECDLLIFHSYFWYSVINFDQFSEANTEIHNHNEIFIYSSVIGIIFSINSWFWEVFVHLLLHRVQLLPTDNKTMKRWTHINIQKLFHFTRLDLLVRIPNPGQTETLSVLGISLFLVVFLSLQQLFDTFLDCHESWRFVNFLVFEDVLLGPFLDFDVD